MRTFYQDSNNGFVALMDEDTYHRYSESSEGQKAEIGPIFIFGPSDTAKREPWIAGDLELMSQLLGGPTMVLPGHFGVPFSNGAELYENPEVLVRQLRRIGTLAEAIEVFEVDSVRGRHLITA